MENTRQDVMKPMKQASHKICGLELSPIWVVDNLSI